MGRLIIFLFMLVFAVCSRPVSALADQAGGANVQSDLEVTLNSLKDSVARLTEENRNMAGVNDQLRLKLGALNDQLKSQQLQGTKVLEQFQAQEPRYQKVMAERSLWEGKLSQAVDVQRELDKERSSAEDAVKSRESEDGALYARLEALTRELSDIRSGLVPEEDGHIAELQPLRTEQLAAQKELDASTAEMERARDEWKELTVAINAGPGNVDVLSKDQAGIKAGSARLSSEIAALHLKLEAAKKQADELATFYSEQGMSKLGQELQQMLAEAERLEKANSEAEQLLGPKVITPLAEAKIKQDEERVKELAQQNKDLKVELKKLQHDMVKLDKKKLDLEKEMKF